MKLNPTRAVKCLTCRMPLDLCLCAATPHLDLATRVVIFMHQKEYCLGTNTGVLAQRILKNSQLVFRGHPNRGIVLRQDFLPKQYEDNTFILFPSAEAIELNQNFLQTHQTPLTLICPDGHWGQANKILRREPSLKNLPCLKLPVGLPSRYRLRRNIVPGRVCTFEALARALGMIEGEHVQDAMETVFEKMVTRLLWMQGRIGAGEVVW